MNQRSRNWLSVTTLVFDLVILLCLTIMLAVLLSGNEHGETVYILVTPTATPTYELFKECIASYCPTPCPCQVAHVVVH